jgi:hypothetical protein
MKTYLPFVLGLMLMTFHALAEEDSGNIEGQIYDGETREPLGFVSVAIYRQHDQELVTGTITEEDGYFSLKGLETGEYYIEVSFIGYEKTVVEKNRSK